MEDLGDEWIMRQPMIEVVSVTFEVAETHIFKLLERFDEMTRWKDLRAAMLLFILTFSISMKNFLSF